MVGAFLGVEQATLGKGIVNFVMETIGDKRQAAVASSK
jgi:hypothetical protein